MNNISALRDKMQKSGISACIIADSDPHLGEYIADYWKEREWISGFDGSNGIAVLTLNNMALWTDSRYTLQAESQLKGTGCSLFISNNPLPEIARWLNKELPDGNHNINIRFDVFSVSQLSTLKAMSESRFQFVFHDLISPLWKNRLEIPSGKAFLLDVKYAGETASDKIAAVRQLMRQANADVLLLTMLDDVAWIFNIRGNDVSYNPVVTAYAIIEQEKAILFIQDEKITDNTRHELHRQGVVLEHYSNIDSYIASLHNGETIWLDELKTNEYLYRKVPHDVQILNHTSPATMLKSRKNDTEIAGIRNSCLKDGVAMTRFCMWLEEAVKNGNVTEISLAEKLRQYRAEQELFVGESFGTIAGFKENGAIVHYHATNATDKTLSADGILLLDSGAQYLNGTTDITRTFALGTLTGAQKKDYTLVLKGHIALANARFPYGTCGYQLDVLARQFLWNNFLNYGHGTGHGIGHFLNVHEGPQSIRTDANTTVLETGMLISNEPGIYRTGQYGIRLENMILVIPDEENEFGKFMRFETVTLFPFDIRAIDYSMLDEKEKEWLRNYHQHVYETLSPHLTGQEKEWLQQIIE